MTNREFFEAVINANINDELTAFATTSIEKLDHTLLLGRQLRRKLSELLSVTLSWLS